MFRTEEDWIRVYQGKNAYWEHDGNSLRPHALLTSGNHSNGFFNSRRVIPDEPLLREAASDLVDHFLIRGGDLKSIDRVVGPQTGATKLAEFISEEIGKRRGRACAWASPAKIGEGEDKQMVFDDSDHMVSRGEVVLLCEDVLTTGGSIGLTLKAILKSGGTVWPLVLVLVNRSGLTETHWLETVALINRSLPIWTPDECPLCRQGSEAIRPKGPEEWTRLNADY